jgi:hypothetical protein
MHGCCDTRFSFPCRFGVLRLGICLGWVFDENHKAQAVSLAPAPPDAHSAGNPYDVCDGFTGEMISTPEDSCAVPPEFMDSNLYRPVVLTRGLAIVDAIYMVCLRHWARRGVAAELFPGAPAILARVLLVNRWVIPRRRPTAGPSRIPSSFETHLVPCFRGVVEGGAWCRLVNIVFHLTRKPFVSHISSANHVPSTEPIHSEPCPR